MAVFVLAETPEAAQGLCACARTLGEVSLVSVTGETALTGIADVVYKIAVPEGEMIEAAAATVAALIAEKVPEIVLAEPTRRMKAIAAVVAAKLGTAVVADVKDLSEGIATTLYFGGVANRTQRVKGQIAIYTCNPSVFGEVDPASGTDVIEEISFVPAAGAKVRSREALPPAGVNLSAAKRVVAAGRGFGSEEELDLAREFAAKVGAELGCSRPLTEEQDWFPREAYIGVSGLMLDPQIYFAIGVSGQIQHMVGVNGANLVFAVNKDKNAPIFAQADYGLVGDIKDVLPQINAKL